MKIVFPRDAVRALVLASALAAGQAAAQAPGGFSVKHEAVIAAPPAEVYRALVEDVGRWWNPAHTYSGDSANLTIDARPGGCFCERLADGGGVEHLRVVHVAPGAMLRLSGGLGPLQAHGVAGNMTWTLEGIEGATSVELTYVVGGFMEGGLERVGGPVGAVIGEQLGRLKQYVETGDPSQDAPEP